jgi:hypothetical protein
MLASGNRCPGVQYNIMFGHKTLARGKRYAHLSEAHTHSVVERRNRAVFGEP